MTLRKRGPKPGSRPGSRRHAMESLALGECVIFVGDPGDPAQPLMASIASAWRGNTNLTKQGLTQKSGLAVFEDELPRPAVRVTRVAMPEPGAINQ